MYIALTQGWALVGKTILAQAVGSLGPEFFSVTSSRTVTCWPLFKRVTTSLLSLAWPRTLTLLAITTAGPATKGRLFSSAAMSFFFAAALFSAFFLLVFFFS